MSNPRQFSRRVRAALAVVPRSALVVASALPCAAVACAAHAPATQVPAPGTTAQAGIPTGGAGTSRTPNDTSSVAVGDARTIERMFTGRFAGVNVQPTSDGGLRITIRGGSASFYSGDEPLYLVDGTPLPSGMGGVVHMNPYDISKIEILKNPQDTGIYGLRAVNGVVRITTLRPGSR